MNKLTIGVDIDGVLANFNRGFAELLIKLTGKKLLDPKTIDPQVWNWPRAAGWNEIEESAAWEYVKQDHQFWWNLVALPGAHEFLHALGGSDHDVYFVTARPGLTAKLQTERWLKPLYPATPTVLITSHKGLAARTLHFDAYIDDRRENCIDVAVTGARVYMPIAGYNAGDLVPGVRPIGRIETMLTYERIGLGAESAAA